MNARAARPNRCIPGVDNVELFERSQPMRDRTNRHTAPPRRRVDVVLALIDKALADCEPELVQLRTALELRPAPR
jgi:hypothetical protein